MNAPHLAQSEHDWSLPYRGLSIPATMRTGLDRSLQTVVTELSTTSFAAQSILRLRPGTRCWLSLPGLAAKQAEVLGWQGSVVTCRFTETLSPLILDSVVKQRSSTARANHLMT